MSTSDLITLANALAGLPIHVVLILANMAQGYAVVILWRRQQVIQDKLDDCLSERSRSSTTRDRKP